eukprot:3145853-Heterocapsa_arctica.AAC.1
MTTAKEILDWIAHDDKLNAASAAIAELKASATTSSPPTISRSTSSPRSDYYQACKYLEVAGHMRLQEDAKTMDDAELARLNIFQAPPLILFHYNLYVLYNILCISKVTDGGRRPKETETRRPKAER